MSRRLPKSKGKAFFNQILLIGSELHSVRPVEMDYRNSFHHKGRELEGGHHGVLSDCSGQPSLSLSLWDGGCSSEGHVRSELVGIGHRRKTWPGFHLGLRR
ncbi:hypothetical protein Bpfe_028064 [Biomphalaria pfeifferi]|uniref:Uncharacterized protein n=1 Tax=Biomphalaria pfeifferi TaxID=112525 RepID=A0AAD8AVQ8_BIOPF|nr:hypothetical protein Bpfe_028064 [Biomphalaria pfeifferi]